VGFRGNHGVRGGGRQNEQDEGKFHRAGLWRRTAYAVRRLGTKGGFPLQHKASGKRAGIWALAG
jgi:hypothetical protein